MSTKCENNGFRRTWCVITHVITGGVIWILLSHPLLSHPPVISHISLGVINQISLPKGYNWFTARARRHTLTPHAHATRSRQNRVNAACEVTLIFVMSVCVCVCVSVCLSRVYSPNGWADPNQIWYVHVLGAQDVCSAAKSEIRISEKKEIAKNRFLGWQCQLWAPFSHEWR